MPAASPKVVKVNVFKTYSAKPGELRTGEILVRIPGQSGPAIGDRIRAVAPREKLHAFTTDGRRRIDL